jgi:hypothetical protein
MDRPPDITRSERLYHLGAWLYLALLPCPLRLAGSLYVHDLLLPLFLAAVLQRADWRRWLHLPDASLAAFGAWAVLATLTRLPGRPDLYELGIFAYMGLLYAFFSRTALGPRGRWRYAVAVAVALWLVGLLQVATGLVQPHSAYVGSTLGFLATRYGFTFGNPNLLASFGILPVACALLTLSGAEAGQGTDAAPPPRRLLAVAAVLLALLLPLLLTASRHLLLSGALILGAVTALTPTPQRRLVRRAAGAALAATFALFYLTILIPFFPLQTEAPYVNARTPGMYMIHQGAYLNLLCRDARTLVFGLGRSAVRQGYPEAVKPALARRVLAEYHMEHLTPSFLAYMDAHNEYLNLATAFGVPALGALGAFLWLLTRGAHGLTAHLLVAAVLGICLASLWDDLLSKRWIWVTLGLLAATAWKAASTAPLAATAPAVDGQA